MQLIKQEEFTLTELTYRYDSPTESFHHRREMLTAGYTVMNRWSGVGTHYALYRKKRATGPPFFHP